MIHYLDNAATTRVSESAAAAALHAMREEFGNPSAIYAAGASARRLLEESRADAAKAVGCSSEELYFTSGGTEGINTAIIGAAERRKSKKHIVTTAVEHHAVLNTVKRLCEKGYTADIIPPEKNGMVSADRVLSAVTDDTLIVSVMAVNNETGARMPIKEIAAELHARGILFHSDTVQALFKLPDAPASLGADIVTVSGHKIGAPKGIGAIYIRKGVSLPPFITGGGQERGFRSGTEPVPGAAAFAAACRERLAALTGDLSHMKMLNEYLRSGLASRLPRAAVISPPDGAPHVLSLALPGTRSEVAVRVLSDMGIYVSGGSACSKGKKSHVLTAMNVPQALAEGALRVSFSHENTKDDIDALLDGLCRVSAMFGG